MNHLYCSKMHQDSSRSHKVCSKQRQNWSLSYLSHFINHYSNLEPPGPKYELQGRLDKPPRPVYELDWGLSPLDFKTTDQNCSINHQDLSLSCQTHSKSHQNCSIRHEDHSKTPMTGLYPTSTALKLLLPLYNPLESLFNLSRAG